MKSILFFARLPLSEEEKMDGEIQRVLLIDEMARAENFNRIYIHLDFRSFINIIYEPKFLKNARAYSLSVYRIKSWSLVVKLIKNSDVTYFHSLHNYKFSFFFKYWLKNTFRIIDFHGIVPEENLFLGNRIRSFVYGLIEKLNIHSFDAYICVSMSMINFYREKYQLKKDKCHLLPMVRNNDYELITDLNDIYRKDLNIPSYKPVVIYVGNCQKWQNIDLMMDAIEAINKDVFLIILSAQQDEFLKIIRKKKITKQILLKSVEHSELVKYYAVANYGFLLRDDHPVNNVANPTKLVEYLQFGLVPIVLSTNTSDIDFMEVDTISLEDFPHSALACTKNQHNIDIYNNFYDSSKYKLSKIISNE